MSIYVSRFASNKLNQNKQQKRNLQDSLQQKNYKNQVERNRLKYISNKNYAQGQLNPMAKSKNKNKNILIAKSTQLLAFFDSFDKQNQKKESNYKKNVQKIQIKNTKNIGQSFKFVKQLRPNHITQLQQEYPHNYEKYNQNKFPQKLKKTASVKSLSLNHSNYSFLNEPVIHFKISQINNDYTNATIGVQDSAKGNQKYDSRKYDWRLSKSKSKQKSNEKDNKFLFNFNSHKKLILKDTLGATFRPIQQQKLRIQTNQPSKKQYKHSSQSQVKKQRKQKKIVLRKVCLDQNNQKKKRTSLSLRQKPIYQVETQKVQKNSHMNINAQKRKTQTHNAKKSVQPIQCYQNQNLIVKSDRKIDPLLYTFGEKRF